MSFITHRNAPCERRFLSSDRPQLDASERAGDGVARYPSAVDNCPALRVPLPRTGATVAHRSPTLRLRRAALAKQPCTNKTKKQGKNSSRKGVRPKIDL